MTCWLVASERETANATAAPSVALASVTLTVGDASAGPGTVSVSALERGVPSLVHTASSAVQSVGDGPSEKITSSSPFGSMVNSKRSRRLFTRRIHFRLAPVRDSAFHNFDFVPDAMSWLNKTRKVNVFDPSWLSGTRWNSAVSVSDDSSSVFRIVPTAVLSLRSAPEALLRVRVIVSRSSSTVSSVIATEIVFVVSPARNVSSPLASV